MLQTLYLPLSFAGRASRLKLTGGTHVPWSPCFHYLSWQWLPCLGQIGYRLACRLESAGFYPRGGGVVHADIEPHGRLSPLRIVQRGRLLRIRGLSAVGRLPLAIAERQRSEALARLAPLGVPVEIEVAEVPSPSPGSFIVLQARFEHSQCCAFGLGERHKPAERVADEAAGELLADIASGGAIDAWLADQLLLPLAFAPGLSELSVSRISRHLLTNAELLGYFLPVRAEIEENPASRDGCVSTAWIMQSLINKPQYIVL